MKEFLGHYRSAMKKTAMLAGEATVVVSALAGSGCDKPTNPIANIGVRNPFVDTSSTNSAVNMPPCATDPQPHEANVFIGKVGGSTKTATAGGFKIEPIEYSKGQIGVFPDAGWQINSATANGQHVNFFSEADHRQYDVNVLGPALTLKDGDVQIPNVIITTVC